VETGKSPASRAALILLLMSVRRLTMIRQEKTSRGNASGCLKT
jgi:hypothetical protein